jgi:hypothetical protein
MRRRGRFAAALLVLAAFASLAPAAARAQDSTGHGMAVERGGPLDTNRIAVMSPMVIQQRLRMLGYSNVRVVGSERRLVTANATKRQRAIAVRLDPYTGKVTEYQGRFERRPEGVMLRARDGNYIRPDTGLVRRPR